MVGFVNRDTEVLKERKGSRGYQGWTDWMPRAHWYGITLPFLHGQCGLPHVCGLCPCASPAALHTPACHSSLSRHQGSPCLSWSSGGSRHVPLLHAESARMLSWLPPAAASKAHHLNVSGPPHPMPTLAASDPPFRTASRQTCHQKESQGSGFSGQVIRIVTSLPSHTAVSWKSVGKTFQ